MDITQIYEIFRETYYCRYYDVYPKVLLADSESVVKVVPLYWGSPLTNLDKILVYDNI